MRTLVLMCSVFALLGSAQAEMMSAFQDPTAENAAAKLSSLNVMEAMDFDEQQPTHVVLHGSADYLSTAAATLSNRSQGSLHDDALCRELVTRFPRLISSVSNCRASSNGRSSR